MVTRVCRFNRDHWQHSTMICHSLHPVIILLIFSGYWLTRLDVQFVIAVSSISHPIEGAGVPLAMQIIVMVESAFTVKSVGETTMLTLVPVHSAKGPKITSSVNSYTHIIVNTVFHLTHPKIDAGSWWETTNQLTCELLTIKDSQTFPVFEVICRISHL